MDTKDINVFPNIIHVVGAYVYAYVYQLLLKNVVENIWLSGLYWSKNFILIYRFYTNLVLFVSTI